ncbi:MAG TPA: zf-HC2 domain-containing protein [Thermoanaerobaculia bacterium]|nr:zf-HC2 domain-containing protein [Thermoanaerobaculia bacterium]
MNEKPDHTLYRELLNLELDGCLNVEQRGRLAAHLAACPECLAERDQLRALTGLLERSALAVEPDFKQRVMASLPASGWESRHPRTWSFPVAALVALLAAGAGLLGAGSARHHPGGGGGGAASAYGVLAALGGLLRAALVAGVGVTTASWRWSEMFVEQLLASPMSLTMFGVFVVCLNLVLVSLIRRGAGRHGSHGSSAAAAAPGPGQGAAARRGSYRGGRATRAGRGR